MISHLLLQTLSVWRPETVDDGAGGQVATFVPAGTIRGQVNQPTVAERQLAQQFGANLTHVVHAMPHVDVRRGDELGGQIPSDVPMGHRLRVIGTRTNSRVTYLGIECEVTAVEQSQVAES